MPLVVHDNVSIGSVTLVTLYYIERVKCVHFKLFGTVYSNVESVSNETRLLRQLAQTI